MRKIATAFRRTYDHVEEKSRDARTCGFVPTGTWSTLTSILPAWMIVSIVYVNFETTWTCRAASRLYARNPDVTSGTDVCETLRTTELPSRCSRFFEREKWAIVSMLRSPITRSARPARTGRTRSGIAAAWYWLSASVFTI